MKMMQIRAGHNWVAVVLLFVVCGGGRVARAQESFLPGNVRSALEQNSRDLSHITVEWERTRTTKMDLEKFFQTIRGVHNFGFFSDYRVLFVWQDSSFYSCGMGKTSLKTIPDGNSIPLAFDKSLELADSYSEVSYDGKEYMGGGGSKKTEMVTPGLWIYPTEKARQVFSESVVCASEYLYFCGFKFTDSFVFWGGNICNKLEKRGKMGKIISV